jgi:hypothetical protein
MEFQLHVKIYGEVEDYINIVAGAADTTAPATPSSLAASGTTTSTTNLSWSASSDNVTVYMNYTKSDCNKYFICCHWFDCKQHTFSVKAKMLPETYLPQVMR